MATIELEHLTAAEKDNVADLPALRAPVGVTPNFDSPSNENAASSALFIVSMIVITLSLDARIYTRFFFLEKPFIGDYILILAYELLFISRT
jgi:hypothetical protein